MRKKTKIRAGCIAFFALACLVGCISHPRPLGTDFMDYAKSYAELNNEQLLLNLARLANDDPVNFMQLGSISSQHQYMAGAQFSPNYVRNSPFFYQSSSSTSVGAAPPTGQDVTSSAVSSLLKNTLTLGGNVTGGLTETPVFQFLPLTGSNLVEAELTPITDKVFFTFYDQGYPADLVARTMVASVQYVKGVERKTMPTGHYQQVAKYRTNVITDERSIITRRFSNGSMMYATDIVTNQTLVVTTNYALEPVTKLTSSTNYAYLVNNPFDPSYPGFLDFCSILKAAQFYHTLTVGSKSDAAGPKSGDDGSKSKVDGPKSEGDTIVYAGTYTSLTDVVAAVQANLTVKCDDTNTGHVTVKQSKKAIGFVINTKADTANASPTLKTMAFKLTSDRRGADTNLFLSESQPDPEKVAHAERLAKGFLTNKYVFKMRTVEAAMYTVAQEEKIFRELYHERTDKPKAVEAKKVDYPEVSYCTNKFGPFALVTRTNDSNHSPTAFAVGDISDPVRLLRRVLQKTDDPLNMQLKIALKSHISDPDLREVFVRMPGRAAEAVTNLSALGTQLLDYIGSDTVLLDKPVSQKLEQILVEALNATLTDRSLVFEGEDEQAQQISRRRLLDHQHSELPDYDSNQFIVRPLMKLTREDGELAPYYKLVEVPYGDRWQKPYFVGDPEEENQNRTVFTMLSYLFGQTAISTQNLPVQQLIQVQ